MPLLGHAYNIDANFLSTSHISGDTKVEKMLFLVKIFCLILIEVSMIYSSIFKNAFHIYLNVIFVGFLVFLCGGEGTLVMFMGYSWLCSWKLVLVWETICDNRV